MTSSLTQSASSGEGSSTHSGSPQNTRTQRATILRLLNEARRRTGSNHAQLTGLPLFDSAVRL